MADPKADPKADTPAPTKTPATPLPQLSEGDRQQLVQQGYATLGGQVYTVAEARELLKRTGQDVELDDPSPAVAKEAARVVAAQRRPDVAAQRGLTHVYPSVAPGLIDPAVAGTPGINGPSA